MHKLHARIWRSAFKAYNWKFDGLEAVVSLQLVALRKLLALMQMDDRARRAALKRDIWQDNARAAGRNRNGGDFYVSFWGDAKAHVFGRGDLTDMTIQRIALSSQRQNLYPELRRGFLTWWNQRRRWTNAPFEPGPALLGRVPFPALLSLVKVENILSVRDGLGEVHYVYPYFAADPELTEDAARLGLWMLQRAFPNIVPEELRILDVIRGQTFSVDRQPLRGDEATVFQNRYATLLQEREAIAAEPPRRRRAV